MLFPDFNDLIALGNQKLDFAHPSSRSVKSSILGRHRSFSRGAGLEFDAVREYTSGDDIRNIDWRVTARTGTPHLKIFNEERERHVVICLDMNSSMRFGTKNTFKSVQAARVAALLGWKAMEEQDKVSVCLFGDVDEGVQFLTPKRTRKSFSSVLKKLTLPPEIKEPVMLDAPLQHINQIVHTGSLVYLISDFMDFDDAFEDRASLSRITKKCDVVFISINDLSDQQMYPMGLIRWQSENKNKILINTDDTAGQKIYANLWQERQKKLQNICSRFKIPRVQLMTDSKVEKDLLSALNKIANRKMG